MTGAAPLHAKSAWRGAIAATALIGFAELAFRFIDPGVVPAMHALRLGHAAFCALLVVVLVARRHSSGYRFAASLFVLGGLPLFIVFWLDEAGRSAGPAIWVPFVGPKLAVLGIALLAPGLWLGLGLIGAFSVETILLAAIYHLGGRAEAAQGEPAITLVYAAISAGLLLLRVRRAAAELAMVHAQAEAAALERFARKILAVRDLANTPLQTLEVNVALLREFPNHPQALARMTRALDRLRELDRVLAQLDTTINWQPGDESLDALKLLEAEKK